MLKYFVILLFVLSLCSCCSLKVDLHNIDSFRNGGGYTFSPNYIDLDSFYNSFTSGALFCYYKDDLMGQEYGPNYSDTSLVILSNELITTITFIDLNQNIEVKSLKSENMGFKFSSFGSISQLIQLLESSEFILAFDLRNLIELYFQYNQKIDISIKNFMDDLLMKGLISEEEFSRLIKLLQDQNIDLNTDLSKLLSYLKNNSVIINLASRHFSDFIKRYKLENYVDLEMLKNSLLTGRPLITLSIMADRKKVWYDGVINYTIILQNIGKVHAKEIYIINALPIGLKYSHLIESNFFSLEGLKCLLKYQILIFHTNQSLGPGESDKIIFSVDVLNKD